MAVALTNITEVSEVVPNFSTQIRAEVFAAALDSAQEYRLSPLLGDALYLRVQTEYVAPTPAIEALLPHVKRFLAIAISLDMLAGSGVQIAPYGNIVKRTDFSDNAEGGGLTRAMNGYNGQLSQIEMRILSIIKDTALYPEYNPHTAYGGGVKVPLATSIRRDDNSANQLQRR